VTRETQLAVTDWLKGNLTNWLRTRNSPLIYVGPGYLDGWLCASR